MENIIHLEYFEEMSSPMKHIYLAYSAIGGALYENYTTSKFKYILAGLLAFQYASYSSTLILALTQYQELDVSLITKYAALLFYLILMVANAVAVYWKLDTFRALFHQMSQLKDDEFIKPNFNFTADHIEEINLENWNTKGFKYNITYNLTVSVFQALQKLVIYTYSGEFVIDYQRDYSLPIPFVESQTLTCYIFIHLITSVVLSSFGFTVYGSMFLPLTISMHLKNLTTRLRNDMKYHTALTFECMEECDRREEKVLNESPKCKRVRNFQLRDIQKQRDRHIVEFTHKVRQWIKYHQKLISCANLFRKCVSPLLGSHVVTCYCVITCSGYLGVRIILDSKDFANEFFFHLVFMTFYLLAACSIVNVVHEMSDDISAEIYSMPWYYLPVKHQKDLLQFLTFTQQSPEIRIFKVFPLSLEKFPELMNDAYGYIQKIRALEMRRVN